jgi:hypothetical protein
MKYIIVLIGLLFVAPAHAAGCYSAKEAEAEQAIRIHSELMVIGLNCQHMTPKGWRNFYSQYREITARHQPLITQYENTLISYNSRNGSSNGERKIHNMRTNFANKISTDAAQMRPDIFCATFAPRIPKVAQMSTSEFQQWAASTAQTQSLSQPVCN